MADAPEQLTKPEPQDEMDYPSYVSSDEDRARWDASKGIAELIFGDMPEQVWSATRAIYGSDMPT